VRPVVVRIAVWGLALCALVYARVLFESHREYEEGADWLARDDADEATVHFRRAALWYAPVNPWGAGALDRLEAIARRAERRREIDRALAAWRAVRGSLLGSRSFYTPMPGRLGRANRRIAALMAKQPRPAQDIGKSEARLAREHYALLARDEAPSVPWSIVLLLGFFGWVGAAFGLVYRGLDDRGRPVPRDALRWAAGLVAGLLVWVLGMALA
jgi:hypothetical protein